DAGVVHAGFAALAGGRIADAAPARAMQAAPAGHGRALAGAVLTGVVLGAGVAVVARAARLGRVGAGPGRGLAGADVVTAIEGRAHDRILMLAGAGQADLGPVAGIAVVVAGAAAARLAEAPAGDRVGGRVHGHVQARRSVRQVPIGAHPHV